MKRYFLSLFFAAAFPVTVLAGEFERVLAEAKAAVDASKPRDETSVRINVDTADRIDRYLAGVTQFTVTTTMSREWDWPARPPDRMKPTSGKITYTAITTMGAGSLHSVFSDSSQRVIGLLVKERSPEAKPFIKEMEDVAFIKNMEGVDGCLTYLLTKSWLDDPPLFSKRIRNESEYKGTTKINGKECHIFVRRYKELDPYYLRVDTYYIPVTGIPLPVKWKYEDHYIENSEPWTVLKYEYTITDSIWPETETKSPGS